MVKRAAIIVLDSLGVGELPDAADYGDQGADTLGHILKEYPSLSIPNLQKLGFCNVQGAAGGKLAVERPLGSFGKLRELSRGKDTITGHWEIAGLQVQTPFQTYPDGFPKECIEEFQKKIGREIIGNYAASGTVIIEDLGSEHEATGKPIVYTSADSVFQIAANTAVIPLEELYRICEIAREMLVGDWSCGRVIARPYVLKDGKRTRTSDRKDYAVSPPDLTMLDHISETGKQTYAVGKISDIFNGQGISQAIHTEDNMDGVDQTIKALNMDFEGLIFANLVDFDSKYGHRRDPEGYGKAIEAFDERLPEIMAAMKESDALILCADHGNDPIHSGWDHTREHVPVVIYGAGIKAGVDLGIRSSFADIGATVCEMLGAKTTAVGTSFLSIIEK